MSSPQYREEEIFAAALQRGPAERAIFLDGACHGDSALRARLDALLNAHDQQASSLPKQDFGPGGTLKISDGDVHDEAVGQTIGRYKLLERLGEGGCGVVYVAEQTEPVRRRVALKVIKLGMDTKQVVARFEAERQALAMMDHPNIAKVLDAGSTEAGRPYFVMELVRGIKITDYCDQAHLSTVERLNLFIKVCQAIQHAHQKGIIHRDIKPSNILVTLHDGVPVPKVIDFGIAKATEGRLTDATVYTQLHQFIGTPVYMSPEQAEMSGLDVDTRSDIYSLGVLLYELLAGSTPFDPEELMSQGLDAMRRTIREKEPVRPSTRLATLQFQELTTTAKRRSSDTSKLVHQLKGDLDWIVMKCLEKDRTRRYETATGLALDLKRHLDNDPVSARPPSVAYKVQKLVRRNKLVFAAAAAVLAALVLGVIGTTVGLVRAEQHRRLAQKNFEQARAAVGDLLAIADNDLNGVPGMQPLRMKLMRSAVERYKPFLEQASSDPGPRAELARLYAKIAFTAHDFGDDKAGEPLYRSAIAIQQQLLREHPHDRNVRSDLGWTYILSVWGDSPDRAKLLADAAAIFEQLAKEDPSDPFARADLAWALWESTWRNSGTNRLAAAPRALEIREQLVKEFPDSADFRRDLANSLQQEGVTLDTNVPTRMARLSRCVDIRERLIADMEKHLPGLWLPARPRDSEALVLRTTLLWTQRDLARGYYRMARGYIGLKQWPAAMSYLERARNIGRKLVEQNPSMDDFANELLITLNFCGYVSDKLGQTAAALSYHKEDADFARARFPNAPDKLALVLNAIAWDYATSDDSDVRNGTMAVELAEEAVRLTKRQNADWIDTLAAAYAENQQFDKAVTTEKEAIALLKADTEIKRYMTNFMQKVNLYQSNKPYHEPKAD